MMVMGGEFVESGLVLLGPVFGFSLFCIGSCGFSVL